MMKYGKALRLILAGFALTAISGCSGANSESLALSNTDAPEPTARPSAPVVEAPLPVPTDADLQTWKTSFRTKALTQGIQAQVFDSAFRDVAINEEVIERDRFQPEFSRAIWDYLDSAVSPTRISNGQQKAALHAGLMAKIEAAHGVDRNIVLAIWGLESAYGFNYGSIPVIESLATLAVEGRRRGFAEEQLVAALRIIQAGDISANRMVGSWAGAMGHTQFIPTSFQAYAVDFTGDGRRDVWAENPADALASAANYLAKFGWSLDAPIVVEAKLPESFDFRLSDGQSRRSAADWQTAGVTTLAGSALPPGEAIEILTPAGARGPAFAAYPNFRVIKRYNNATSYALAVAHLTDRIGGTGPFVQAWPRGDKPLARSEKIELQQRLSALGYSTGGVDGIIGPNTRSAVRAFQQANGLVPDGYISTTLLNRIRGAG